MATLPPPPQGQTGITLDQFKHLPPPPKGQTGVTLAQLQTPQQSTQIQPQSLLDTIGSAAQGVSNFFGGKGISDLAGATIAKTLAPQDQKQYVDFPTPKAVAGSALQLGANLIPDGAELGLEGKAALAAKTGLGALAGYGMDTGSKLQNNDVTAGQPGIATAAGSALPIAGEAIKPATAFVGKVISGLGAGLSGFSQKSIEQIVNNPKAAQKAQQIIAQKGASGMLEDSAKTIVNGISNIRQGARADFGTALEGIKATDINPQTFRDSIQPVLDKFGSSMSNGKRTLSNVEFTDPKNIAKASSLIDQLHSAQLDGGSLRKLSDDIENAKYKTATSDERLSFNAFIKDLSGGVKNAITASTDKLGEANKNYSTDMQLAKAAEGIFGKVNFKNLPEIVNASKKVEGLFKQGGIAPDVADRFLTRIGVNPSDFRTGETVRQMGTKELPDNGVGLKFGEILPAITSAAITPETVGKIATVTGLSKEAIEPFLNGMKGLSTSARNTVLQALLQNGKGSQQ